MSIRQQRFGIDRVDVVLVSHFHDDHVSGIPVLQRLQRTPCWAAEPFADLLEQPAAHGFPCHWFVGPPGWVGSSATCQAEARAEVSGPFTIQPHDDCRRQPFAAELTGDGQPYGQVAKELLTVGPTF